MNLEQSIAEVLRKIEDGTIRALSVRQPWCHHIFYDGKDVENRNWPTKLRGWFLLHAGKAWGSGPPPRALSDVPRGGIVGAARIVDCVEKMDSRWFFGRYGFVLADAFAIPLVTCKGALGFFSLDDETLTRVASSLGELQ